MAYGKASAFSRKFVFFGEFDNYCETLKNKVTKTSREYDMESLEKLLNSLKELKNSNENSFNKIISVMNNFTEEFVLVNSDIITELINIEETELNLIANKCDYDNDYEVLSLVETIINNYDVVVKSLCDSLAETTDVNELTTVALELKEDENFVLDVNLKMIELYPIINEHEVLKKLMDKLSFKCGKIAYDYLKDTRSKILSEKEYVYEDYFASANKARFMKRQKGQRANPKPLRYEKK